jgi:hypothetical protein
MIPGEPEECCGERISSQKEDNLSLFWIVFALALGTLAGVYFRLAYT